MNTPTKVPEIRGQHEKTLRKVTMKFFEEIECEHGWTDDKGFAHCDLGSGCSIGMESFCTKEDCFIYEEDEEDTYSNMDKDIQKRLFQKSFFAVINIPCAALNDRLQCMIWNTCAYRK